MKIVVTTDHINKGHRRSHCRCPIALALIDAGYLNPNVRRTFAYFYSKRGKGNLVTYSLPQKARRFINTFDTEGRTHVQPLSFHLVRTPPAPF